MNKIIHIEQSKQSLLMLKQVHQFTLKLKAVIKILIERS